ncbi:MAG: hypothetical protein IPJ48_19490 [Propionivibrio sp.]|uniref:PH domain-containing protein n=1 Tax=Candidatus Propionivibrio dominans TaxID=2954373 RepID=A0A9D7FFM8_9RHOO|nr:hypothetical protein [Candidatus Propionivibrio dominans]MBL0166766.1 hypothetical protein [Propionivibrio sp.]
MDDSQPDDEKQRWTEALRRHLKTAKALRQQANQAPAAARKRLLLREWQAARLARSYAGLLASERFGQAAQFFLSDLYGPKDFSSRDEEVERILPLLVSLLPASALQTIALAIEVDALTEQLDAAMVVELERAGTIDCIDEDAYTATYRQVGRRPERERQIVLIRTTGEALERLAKNSLLTTLLKLMRAPAQLAGLGDLHAFLASGFAAFRRMGNAREFLDCIESTERKLFQNMFSDVAKPFAF